MLEVEKTGGYDRYSDSAKGAGRLAVNVLTGMKALQQIGKEHVHDKPPTPPRVAQDDQLLPPGTFLGYILSKCGAGVQIRH